MEVRIQLYQGTGPIHPTIEHRAISEGQILYIYNTPGTAGGPGGRDRTLAVKSRKT